MIGTGVLAQQDAGHGKTNRDGYNGRYTPRIDPADAHAVAEAFARFEALTSEGFTAAARTGSGTSELVRDFDPAANETLFFPRLRGG